MRDSEYLIVHKSILPPYFEQVIAARELINNQKINICDTYVAGHYRLIIYTD